MRLKIFSLLFSLLCISVALTGQTGLVSGNLNVTVFPTNLGGGKFRVAGVFSDPKGRWFTADVDTGMVFWKGNNMYLIDSIITASGSNLTIRVRDIYSTGFISTGTCFIVERTPKGIPGVSVTGDSNPSFATPPDYAAGINNSLVKIDSLLDTLETMPLAGDLDGNLPDPLVIGLNGVPLAPASATPDSLQVLQYNGSQWTPVTFLSGIMVASDSFYVDDGNTIALIVAGDTIFIPAIPPPDGNGIYGGSGTVALEAIATLQANGVDPAFAFRYGNGDDALRLLSNGGDGDTEIRNESNDAEIVFNTAQSNYRANLHRFRNTDFTKSGFVAIQEPSGNDYVQIQSPSLAAPWALTLPNTNGNSGEVLTTDGNGVTSWSSGGGGGSFNSFNVAADSGTPAVISDGETVTFSGGTGVSSTISGNTVTHNIDNTGVTAATYGSASQVAQSTYNAQGQATGASNVTIAISPSQVTGTAATTASNGLTKTSSNIELGGTLTGNTSIGGAGTYDFDLSALDSLSLSFAKRLLISQNSQRFLHQTGGGAGGGVFENLFFGYQAGASALGTGQGYANTVIGSRAGYNLTLTSAGGLTTASSNVFLGYASGEACTNCTGNTFLGTASGSASVSTYANTYVGWHAGISATGSYNTFVGREAGNSSTSSEITALGYSAGRNTTGLQNTFVGTFAGETGTTARRNTYMGHSAGQYLSSGSEENCFFGWRAGGGAANVSAGYNTAIGSECGYSLTSGNTNTFVGRNAGKATTSGSGNVLLGNNANSVTTGSNNFLVSIGAAAFPATTQSNSLLIGPDIYATGMYTGASFRMALGNGTFRNPNATLHVRAYTKSVNDTIFTAGNSTSGTSPFNNFFITADGGLVSQQESGVSVSGVPLARFISSYAASGSSNAGWGTMAVYPTINETSADTTWGYRVIPTLTSASDFIGFWTNNSTGVGFASTGTATNYFRGKVGIGSGTYPTPARDLHVAGEARITDLTTDAPTRFVGADADGDLGAITEGFGINITAGGAAEVDTTQLATPADIAAATSGLVAGTATAGQCTYWTGTGTVGGEAGYEYSASTNTFRTGKARIDSTANGDGLKLTAFNSGNILTEVTIDATGNTGLLFDDGALTIANNISEVADTVTRTLGTGQQIYGNGYAGYSGTGFSYSSGRITNGSGASRICKIRYYFTAETAGTLTDALTVKVMIWDGATYSEHRAGRLTLTLVDNVAIVGAKETVITLPDGDGVNIAFDSTDGLDVSNFGYVIEKI